MKIMQINKENIVGHNSDANYKFNIILVIEFLLRLDCVQEGVL